MRLPFLGLTSLLPLRPSHTRINFIRYSSYVSAQSAPEQEAINKLMVELLKDKSPLKKKLKHTKTKVFHSEKKADEVEGGNFQHELHGFKFPEHLYKASSFPMPIRARGLHFAKVNSERVDEKNVKFTGIDPTDSEWKGDWKIILRGYDKYFNVGEVPFTKWPNIPSHSVGPYYATAKENGCLILISALPPPSTHPSSSPQIIVSSKHKIDGEHSIVGQNWLEKHLESCSPPWKVEDLAKELYEKNITVACELCDDSFEEHVLEYPPERSGLHVHGLNKNTVGFETLPMEEVLEFSNRWGFLKPRWEKFETVQKVKEFTDEVRKNGSNWDGTNLEGFVVRGVRKEVDHENGPAFFWKVKYDEPYLMYREWREVTKMILKPKGKKKHKKGNEMILLQKKYRHTLTKDYVEWALNAIKTYPQWFEKYTSNHGIIDVRNKFLDHLKETKGKSEKEIVQIVIQEHQKSQDYYFPDLESSPDYTRTLIATIAIPGSGKTLLSVALSKLFNFSHVQSDNMVAKNKGKAFENHLLKALHEKVVVIADKNNHLKQHRKFIMNVKKRTSNHRVRTIALVFDTGAMDKEKLLEICGGRITSRGNNHQTLRPDVRNSHLEVVQMFIDDSEPLDSENNPEDNFDHIIRVGVEEDISTKLRKVVKELVTILNLEMPTEEAMDNAIKDALDYTPPVFPQEKPFKNSFDYFAILLDDFEIKPLMDKLFENEKPSRQNSIYYAISKKRGWKADPHVTLIHSNDAKQSFEKQKLWCQYEELVDPDTVNGEDRAVEITVGPKLLWDSRIMCLEVSSIQSSSSSISLPLDPNLPAHITLGFLTRNQAKKSNPKVKPVEAKLLTQAFREGKTSTPLGGEIYHKDIEPMVLGGWLSGCYSNLVKQKGHLKNPIRPK